MTHIEMNACAALFLGSDWTSAQREGARTFPTVAQAVRFAIEEAAPVSLHGARMLIGDQTLAGHDIADLYQSPAYPFPHKVIHRFRPSRAARWLRRLEHDRAALARTAGASH